MSAEGATDELAASVGKRSQVGGEAEERGSNTEGTRDDHYFRILIRL